jgi:hypothetical protein
MTRTELDKLSDMALRTHGIYRKTNRTYVRAIYAMSATAGRVAVSHYEDLVLT